MTDDRLDNLLRLWASRYDLDETHARRLANQIIEELGRPSTPEVAAPEEKRHVVPRRWKLASAMAAAAALLLVATVASLLSRWPGAANSDVAAVPPVALIRESELSAGTRLFCESEWLFGNDLRWIAESRNGVRMEIRHAAEGTIPGTAPLLIRIVVTKRNDGGTRWEQVQETVVLTRNEQLIELAEDPKTANRLTLWGYTLPDGKIALDASIHLSAPIHAAINITNILDPGTPKRVFSLKTGDGEYRIYEVVMPLTQRTEVTCTRT